MVTSDQEIDLLTDSSNLLATGSSVFVQYVFGEVAAPNDWIEVDLPDGDCPPGTTLGFQLDAATDSGTIALDYYVQLMNSTTLTAIDCATLICQQFQTAVFDQLGVLLTCIPVQDGSDISLQILPPAGEDCSDLYASGSGSLVQLTMPASLPADTGVNVWTYGITDSGDFAYHQDSLVVSGATPTDLANTLCAAIQAEFNAMGVLASCSVTTIGSDVVLQLFAPLFDPWSVAEFYVEICELR